MARSTSSPEGADDLPVDPSPQSIRDRFPAKRNPCPNPSNDAPPPPPPQNPSARRRPRSGRKLLKRSTLYYGMIFFAAVVFVVAPLVLQSSMPLRNGGDRRRRLPRLGDLKVGASLKFIPTWRFVKRDGLEFLRDEDRIANRPPRIGLILGNMRKTPESLMLFTVMQNLQLLGYRSTIFAAADGEARSVWGQLGGRVSILNPERFGLIDWSIFDGIIADSLEAREAISSLMQEPFCSIPLIWIIQEDTLANRFSLYEEMGRELLKSYWKSGFSRADIVVFPDFSLPMLYRALDSGNFFAIPASPKDVWSAESFSKIHSKQQLRIQNGFTNDDMVVLVVGSFFFFNELSWDYAVAMHDIGPLLRKYARRKDGGGSFKFIFLCGNSSDGYNVELQEMVKYLRLNEGSVRHYGMNNEVNRILLMADIVLYGSSQDEQGFPSLLTRAMTFNIPIIAPDFPVIKKYMVDRVHGVVFPKHNPDELMKGFSELVVDGKLSRFAHTLAYSGRLLAKNMLASECITGFARLMETVLDFPSDASLPLPVTQLPLGAWDWNMFEPEVWRQSSDSAYNVSPIVYALEGGFAKLTVGGGISCNETGTLTEEIPTDQDWNVLREMESAEDYVKRETEEVEERKEKSFGSWDEIYNFAKRAEKFTFEANERDEGELERTGQPLCIYEIYKGAGTWPFLSHGSFYRGLSLSTRGRRLKSDDVDAVKRLPLLNYTRYADVLCEAGGMLSIANKIDNIHRRPWIGFQSWRAAGRKLSLSIAAERVLEERVQKDTKGDVMYFWVRLDMDIGLTRSEDSLTFWSICDMLNEWRCRTAFEDAFRRMYSLTSSADALPPMPEDGGHWSARHSWAMPTSSFLQFMRFTRMFVDSLHALHPKSGKVALCLLGSSEQERKHCYCRLLEVLVNVWAYHSARKMVYINPRSGSLEEQHPVEQRKGFMWTRYFNTTLLKHMDEDLAEAADDGDYPSGEWLWPLTGEVHWPGLYEKEREEKYRRKMEKKRRTKEKLLDRMKHGYKQKKLGG